MIKFSFSKIWTGVEIKRDGINLFCFQPKRVEFPEIDMISIEDIREAGKGDMDLIRGALDSWDSIFFNARRIKSVSSLASVLNAREHPLECVHF